jgi:hypothetical protein
MISLIAYQRSNLRIMNISRVEIKGECSFNENYEMCMKGRSSILLHSTSARGIPYTPMNFPFNEREM